jgi:CDP-diacylglycerol pyrophosphatase
VIALAATALFVLFSMITGTARAGKPVHRHENPDVLWHFVHDRCAPAAARGVYPPTPCAEVDHPHDASRGYVVFKDRDGRYQYLVLPLARITGIESPALLSPDATNYIADAWTARMYVEAALHQRVPRDVIGLVVNSRHGRSQNQLHIHVDCIRPDVHATLQSLAPTIGTRWKLLPARLPSVHGRRYMARWLGGANLATNPFRLLKKALPAGDRMGMHSLAVIGAYDAHGRPGFILLSTHENPSTGNNGNSDALHDRTCALVKAPHPPQSRH